MTAETSEEDIGLAERNAGGVELRLYLDLDVCEAARCPACNVECSYALHPGNNGVLSLAERAAYALVCRRCEVPHCVRSCPCHALEQDKDNGNLLVRHGLRCVSCRTCSHACPYGTIFPELVPLIVHVCDFCAERRNQAGEPRCTRTCPKGALELRAVDGELPANTFRIGKHLAVHSIHWEREKA